DRGQRVAGGEFDEQAAPHLGKRVARNNDAAVGPVRKVLNGLLDLGRVPHRRRDDLDAERRRGGIDGVEKDLGLWRCLRIEYHQDPLDARRDFLEQIEPLAGATKPCATGSATSTNTIGTPRATSRNAMRLVVEDERMTSGCRPTRSFA